MKKSAKILVIAALIVSAVVMTSCSNLMTLIAGKPEGTYLWEDSSVENGTMEFEFDGTNFTFRQDINFAGYRAPSSYTGTIKLNGAKATIKTSTNKGVEGYELISDDRWYSFTVVSKKGDELWTFKKR